MTDTSPPDGPTAPPEAPEPVVTAAAGAEPSTSRRLSPDELALLLAQVPRPPAPDPAVPRRLVLAIVVAVLSIVILVVISFFALRAASNTTTTTPVAPTTMPRNPTPPADAAGLSAHLLATHAGGSATTA